MKYKPPFELKTCVHFSYTSEDYIQYAEVSLESSPVHPWWYGLYKPSEESFTAYHETKELTFPQPEEVQATLRLQAQQIRRLMAEEGHTETRESRKKF